jgi:DNA-binding response OmpR family regulator
VRVLVVEDEVVLAEAIARGLRHQDMAVDLAFDWDEHADPFTDTVRVTVGNLRRKLGNPPLIETVIGAGYRL